MAEKARDTRPRDYEWVDVQLAIVHEKTPKCTKSFILQWLQNTHQDHLVHFRSL